MDIATAFGDAFKKQGALFNKQAELMYADKDGAPKGTRKTLGYVYAIHGFDDKREELRGTVDVQEYEYEDDYDGEMAGFHQGVKLSAISGNEKGIHIVPQLYSDVIITQDPRTQEEYVLMYSQVQDINVAATEKVIMGVTELEPFKESDNGLEKDYDELAETGKKASVTITKDGFAADVSDNGEGLTENTTPKEKVIKVGDTTITVNGDSVIIETSSKVSVKTKDATIESTNTTIKADKAVINSKDATITGGKLTVKGTVTPGKGPFTPILTCPFSGAPHCGSLVSGT